MADDDDLAERLRIALEGPHREPPAERVAALRAQAAGAARDASPMRALASRRDPTVVRWAAAAAVVVALVVSGVALALAGRDRSGGDLEFAGALVGPGAEATATVRRTGIGRVIHLETDELEILPTGELYEVWFASADDSLERPDRISAGTFHPDAQGRTDVRLAAAVDPAQYPILLVTAEPGDGDPAPGGPEVLRAVVG